MMIREPKQGPAIVLGLVVLALIAHGCGRDADAPASGVAVTSLLSYRCWDTARPGWWPMRADRMCYAADYPSLLQRRVRAYPVQAAPGAECPDGWECIPFGGPPSHIVIRNNYLWEAIEDGDTELAESRRRHESSSSSR